jgi:hypothetical protein
MNWFQRNFNTIIYTCFLVPILTVAFVSISHVSKWYGISNPMSWAIYLSIGIEIAALSALAAISAQMGRKVYFPFGIVTLIQFIGNIFFAYQYIDITSQSFKDWMDMVDPLVSFLGVESGDVVGHKRFLALFAGGMLPIISLSFLHMLVKFEEEEKKKSKDKKPNDVDIDELSIAAGKKEFENDKLKYTPTENELQQIEEQLKRLNDLKFGKTIKDEIVPEEVIETPIENISQEDDWSNEMEEEYWASQILEPFIETEDVPEIVEVIIESEPEPEETPEPQINRLSYLRRDA